MKRERLAVAVVVLVAVAGLAVAGSTGSVGASADGTASVVIEVTVLNEDRLAVSGATLTATWDGGSFEATTLSDGKTRLEVEEGADVEITVEHPDFTRNNPRIVEDAEAGEITVDVARKATARVTVVSGGSPVPDATVRLRKEGQTRLAARGTTGSDGVLESGTIEAGTYVVTAVEEGYLRNETTVEVRDTTDATVVIEEGTATVRFSVTDDHFDPPRPIEGASITIEGPITTTTTTTSASGERTLGLAANSEFDITVTKDGYTEVTRTVRLGETDRTVSLNISREPSVTVEAANERVVVGERVEVTATDAYGDPVPNATVLVDGEAVGETDAEGSYRATVDAEGEQTIEIRTDAASGSVTVEGITPDDDSPTPTAADGETATASPSPTSTEGSPNGQLPLGDLDRPTLLMQAGVAAIGLLVAIIVVRLLL